MTMNNYEFVPKDSRHIAMEKRAGLMAILAIISSVLMTVILPYVFGAMSIFFAYLSKGKTGSKSVYAHIAVICSIVIMISNTVLMGVSVYTVFTDEKLREEFNTTYEKMYGQSFDEVLKEYETMYNLQFSE